MPDKKFLASVASFYADGAQADSLARYVFVMPNKRSGLFLKDHFKNLLSKSDRPVMMPRFHTIQYMMADLACTPAMPRNEQLFLLYDCYRQILAEHGQEQDSSFDRFAFWGDIILNDFNDIDSSLADASKLFGNLTGLKSLSADFLTDEQKEIVRALWGESELTLNHSDRFWNHMPDTARSEEAMSSKFLHLWQILGLLYERFKEALRLRGMTTEGGQQRLAVERVNRGEIRHQPRIYIFTGISDVSNAQYAVMRGLHQRGLAQFFWDYTMLPAHIRDLAPLGAMLKRLVGLNQQFPSPEGYQSPTPSWPDEILCVGIPSNIGQTRYMGDTMSRWFPELTPEDGEQAKTLRNAELLETAVVMPDDKLLVPAVMSLPPGVESVNVTMSLPYIVTSFATLLSTIVSLQMRTSRGNSGYNFFYEDVERILTHPILTKIAPEQCYKALSTLRRNRRFKITTEEIVALVPQFEYIFQGNFDPMRVADVHAYIDRLLDCLGAEVKQLVPPDTKDVETEMLDYFKEQLGDLYRLVVKYDVQMKDSTYFILFERLLSVKRIDLHGSPLKGLQMMGVLETRTLDFDRLFILSANERMLPRRNYLRTMIPGTLRQGFMMNTAYNSDSEYTYHFYRMLSGARRVIVTYDSRGASFGAGEMSRYLKQLRFMPGSNIRFMELQLKGMLEEPEPYEIDKNDSEVRSALDRFRKGGKYFLSASSLKTYKACPMKFYFQYLNGINQDDELNDYLTAADYGTVVHDVLEQLYKEHKGHNVDSQTLRQMMADKDKIDRLVHRAIYLQLNPDLRRRIAKLAETESITKDQASERILPSTLPQLLSEYNILKNIIKHFVLRTLEIECKEYNTDPFVHIDDERKVEVRGWELEPGLSINFKMIIDRIDRLDSGDLRFIDYKTGSDSLRTNDIEQLFDSKEHNYDAIFQLLLYGIAYAKATGFDGDIVPSIYSFRDMLGTGGITPVSMGTPAKATPITGYRQYKQEFSDRFTAMVRELFDTDIPFRPNEHDEACTYCSFVKLCGKTLPQKK